MAACSALSMKGAQCAAPAAQPRLVGLGRTALAALASACRNKRPLDNVEARREAPLFLGDIEA
ncbi:MAG: hypothetical protein N2690_00025 [Rhodocyclaceae bacterium]|nr:hypothetical protein [Rhodocyclaceae bacterium]